MSQLLSKLDPSDNTNFGREMQRAGKEENVSNLITWLHQEATLRSRVKRETDNAGHKDVPTEEQHLEGQTTTPLTIQESQMKKHVHLAVRRSTC